MKIVNINGKLERLELKEIDIIWDGNLRNPKIYGFWGPDYFGNEVFVEVNSENELKLYNLLDDAMPKIIEDKGYLEIDRAYDTWKDSQYDSRSN